MAEIGRRWLLLAGGALAGLFAAMLYLAVTPPRYTATMILGAAQKTEAQSLSQGLSGLALPSFLNLGGLGQNTQFTEFRYKALGVTVAQRLDERHGIARRIFADRWDDTAQGWVPPPASITRWPGRFLRRLSDRPEWTPPSAQQLSEYLRTRVKFVQLEQTGLWRLSYADKDPEFARNLLGQIVEETDSLVRAEDRVQLAAMEKLLESELQRVVATDLRLAVNLSLVSVKRQLALINTTPQYAAKIIDAASVGDAPDSPSIPTSLVLGLILGLVGSFVTVLLIIHRKLAKAQRRLLSS